jgi:hypothetical protein
MIETAMATVGFALRAICGQPAHVSNHDKSKTVDPLTHSCRDSHTEARQNRACIMVMAEVPTTPLRVQNVTLQSEVYVDRLTAGHGS